MKTRFMTALFCLTLPPLQIRGELARAGGLGMDKIPPHTGAPSADLSTDQAFIARRATAQANESTPKPQPVNTNSFGLLEMSTAIQNGVNFILVPRGSVLWCPPEQQAKIVKQPAGRFTELSLFMASNRNWITTYEVTREQVTGKAPIPADVLARFQKNGSLVLATLQGNPITVIPHAP